jgi:hydrogenase-4 component E
MAPTLDLLLVVVLLLNFFVLVASQPPAAIRLVGIQGMLIGFLPLLVHEGIDIRLVLLTIVSVVFKGFVFPRMLMHALREVGFRRERAPVLGFIPSLLMGAVGTGLALAFSSTLPLAPQHVSRLVVPASLSTVLIGYLILATRQRAVTQTLGYLVLENGIFLFGLLLVEAMPLLIELGVLLDLFVGVFVMGITIQHLTRGFASDSTEHLSALKE